MKLDEIELQFEVDWRGHEGHILVKCNDLELDEKSITRAIEKVEKFKICKDKRLLTEMESFVDENLDTIAKNGYIGTDFGDWRLWDEGVNLTDMVILTDYTQSQLKL